MHTRLFLSASMLTLLATVLAGCGEKAASKMPVAVSAAAPVVNDGSLMVPGRPQLARLPASVPLEAVQPVTWNMWWGENGRQWKIYVNGKMVDSGTVTSKSPKAQQATVAVALEEAGPVEIKVALCNDHGCSESEPTIVNVAAS